MDKIQRQLTQLNRLVTGIAAAIVLIMVLHVAFSAVLRYGFNRPLSGSMIIVSYWYMVFIVFLPLGKAEDDGEHITVDVLYSLFGPRLQALSDFAATAISISVTGLLAWRTWLEFTSKFREQAGVFENGVHIILWPTYLALPVGFALMCLTLTLKLFLRHGGQAKAA